LIKEKLKENGLNQNDLAQILGHRKGYMSELINGLRPFSREDIVVINRLLKIKLENLMPTFIKQDRAEHIKRTLKTLSNSKIKPSNEDFDLQFVYFRHLNAIFCKLQFVYFQTPNLNQYEKFIPSYHRLVVHNHIQHRPAESL
jgi:transcriptional regulator with XRE-family HTH domain